MKLLIYCAGGLGKEVYDLAVFLNKVEKRWDEISFIDDVRKESKYYGARIYKITDILHSDMKNNVEIIIANGEPFHREAIYNKVIDEKLTFSTLIHPSVLISPSAKIGEGVVLRERTSVASDAVIGTNTYVQPFVAVGHDTVIGKHCVLSSHSFYSGKCMIDNRSYIAPGALIKNKVVIGKNSIIGMGSVVLRNVKENSIVAGNPACKIGDNTEHTVFNLS